MSNGIKPNTWVEYVPWEDDDAAGFAAMSGVVIETPDGGVTYKIRRDGSPSVVDHINATAIRTPGALPIPVVPPRRPRSRSTCSESTSTSGTRSGTRRWRS